MNFYSILIIAIGLGMDAFAVAIGAGVALKGHSQASAFRLSSSFGFFQFIMPIIGWSAGLTISTVIQGYDHWLAFVLLAAIGGKMIYDALRDGKEISFSDPTKGLPLLMLSIATSIDALAVGLSLAFLKVAIFYPSVVIGTVAFAMTWIGMAFGERLGRVFGKKVEVAGGLILLGIGVKILLEHLWT
ncbi:MAG: manganese efflux pump MntP family protein [Deltaproteobacteria bacterium]|nr:manganese efflux pump MntP family protein [Deltaproteobacteria bacterium]